MTNFENLGLSQDLLKAIQQMGFESPSEVQQQAIPVLLQEETDLVALAQTGTGKTAAFGFPLIQQIDLGKKKTQGLILSPTRELCLQITNEIEKYSQFIGGMKTVAIYGGASISDQERQINRGAHIIVATPGRMKDMISRRMIDITEIDVCVLDEADEMLNMGFYEDIQDILKNTPKDRKTWLFSATMPKEVAQIAKDFMKTPQEITVGRKNVSTKNVSHEYFLVGGRDRYPALKRLVDVNPDIYAAVFCRTKRDTQKVAEKLIEDGYSAAALHGDLSQQQRDLVMKSFRNKQVQMLVATDVAARGIDVDDITHVINYQLPDEIETYTHRSGRTGRAGKTGKSLVIVTKGELRKIKQIEKIIGQKFVEDEVPTGDEICKKQLFYLAGKIATNEASKDIDTFLPQLEEQLAELSKEDLIKKFFSVEFDRFNSYYKKQNELRTPSASEKDFQGKGRADFGNENRFFINLGKKDGLDWMQLKDFLKEALNFGRDDVGKVDVMDTFSFFNVDKSKTDTVLEILNNLELNGRKVSVEITEKKSKGGGRGRGDRNRSRSGSGGGHRKGKPSGFKSGQKNNSKSKSFARRRAKNS